MHTWGKEKYTKQELERSQMHKIMIYASLQFLAVSHLPSK